MNIFLSVLVLKYTDIKIAVDIEVFEYDPVSIFLFPPKLSVEKTR